MYDGAGRVAVRGRPAGEERRLGWDPRGPAGPARASASGRRPLDAQGNSVRGRRGVPGARRGPRPASRPRRPAARSGSCPQHGRGDRRRSGGGHRSSVAACAPTPVDRSCSSSRAISTSSRSRPWPATCWATRPAGRRRRSGRLADRDRRSTSAARSASMARSCGRSPTSSPPPGAAARPSPGAGAASTRRSCDEIDAQLETVRLSAPRPLRGAGSRARVGRGRRAQPERRRTRSSSAVPPTSRWSATPRWRASRPRPPQRWRR